MGTATLTRPHRRTSAWTTCRRHSGTRTLKDRFATLRHNSTRRGGCCRTYGRQVNRTRPGLRHYQPARGCGGLQRLPRTSRNSGLRRPHAWLPWQRRRSSGTPRSGWHGGDGFNLGSDFRGENFGCKDGSLRFIQDCNLIFDGCLDWLRSFGNGGCMGRRRGWGRWRLGPHNYCGRRTRHRLWRDETRCGLRLNRRCRLRAGGCGERRRGLGRNSRRRSHSRPRWDGLARRRHLTRRCGRLGGPLRDGLQHIAWLGDVRKIDLRLELFRRRSARAAARTGLMLLKILLNALRLVLFDGTGVRLLFRYSDLEENVKDFFALDLELSGQIVDSNLVLHSALFPPLCPVRSRLHSILTVQWPVAGCQWPVRISSISSASAARNLYPAISKHA